jgi:hypothetical protein
VTVIAKIQALQMIRRAYGPDVAASLANTLPDQVDLDDARQAEPLSHVGVTLERLFNALGAAL